MRFHIEADLWTRVSRVRTENKLIVTTLGCTQGVCQGAGFGAGIRRAIK
jgi:hypothetical protein